MIPHSRPFISEKEIEAVIKVLESGQLSQDKYVSQFEEKCRELFQKKYAVATSSGTAALHLALLSLDIGSGDEVILPSYVCSALLNAVYYVGATPRLVDVGEDYNIDVVGVREKVNSRTKALIVPHMFGGVADVDGLLNIGVPLIEDCAQSLGATYKGRPAGSSGLLTICSFYSTKVISTGEGGMVLTDSEELEERIRDLKDYDEKKEYRVRYNYKMTEIQATLGVVQVSRLHSFISRRKEIASRYTQAFSDLDLLLPLSPEGRDHIFYRYVIRAKGDWEKYWEKLRAQGVECKRPVYKPLHHYMEFRDEEFPMTRKVFETAISVPIYPAMKEEEVTQVIGAVRKTFPRRRAYV